MEELVLEVLKNLWLDFKETGILGKISFLFFLSFFVSLFIPKLRIAFIDYLKAIKGLFTKEKINWNTLMLFKNREFLLDKVNDISFDNDTKTNLFITLLKIKINVSIDILKEYVNELIKKKRLKKISKEQLVTELRLVVIQIINTYENKIELEYIKKYGDKKGKLFFNCIYLGKCEEQKVGFKKFHEKNVGIIEQGLQNALETEVSNDFVLYGFIQNIYIALWFAITDLYKTFKNFNGFLLKIIEED